MEGAIKNPTQVTTTTPTQEQEQKTTINDQNLDSIVGSMGNVNQVTTTTSKIQKIINGVIKLLQVAGSGIAVIMVTILGARYMMASANEKADIKKQAMPMIVGCVILFAAVNLVAIVAGIGNELN